MSCRGRDKERLDAAAVVSLEHNLRVRHGRSSLTTGGEIVKRSGAGPERRARRSQGEIRDARGKSTGEGGMEALVPGLRASRAVGSSSGQTYWVIDLVLTLLFNCGGRADVMIRCFLFLYVNDCGDEDRGWRARPGDQRSQIRLRD